MNKQELVEELKKIGIDNRYYSLDGSLSDGIVMKNYHGIWEVFYFERGKFYNETKFYSEDEACKYVYKIFEDSPESIPGRKKCKKKEEIQSKETDKNT